MVDGITLTSRKWGEVLYLAGLYFKRGGLRKSELEQLVRAGPDATKVFDALIKTAKESLKDG